MSILLGKSVDFVVLRRHLNRCGFMNEHVSTFVSQPGASASPLGGQCHPSSPRVLHSLGLWPGRHSNLFVTLPTLPSGVRRTSILTAQRTISPLFTNTLLRGYRA